MLNRSRAHKHYERKLNLPPPFRLVSLREAGDAFAHACGNAPALGAGALVFAGRFHFAEFAAVLEPEEPLATARRAFCVCMAALGDALAALAPPEKTIAFEWPDAVLIDGGLIGGGRLGWPAGGLEDDPPEWLVFGVKIRTAFPPGDEPGAHPLATALEEEGFSDAGPGRIVEGFTRHLMVAADRWREEGFGPAARLYSSKLKPERGARREIDGRGNLLIRRGGEDIECLELSRALATPSWLDPHRSEPRL